MKKDDEHFSTFTVGELKERLKGLSDDTPLLGSFPGNGATSPVEVYESSGSGNRRYLMIGVKPIQDPDAVAADHQGGRT